MFWPVYQLGYVKYSPYREYLCNIFSVVETCMEQLFKTQNTNGMVKQQNCKNIKEEIRVSPSGPPHDYLHTTIHATTGV